MNFSLVAAMDINYLIGKDNDLPWKRDLPEDLKFVKELTTDNVIIMGRKNYESIGRPLPNRRNIILTRDENYTAEGCEIFHTIDDILNAISNDDLVFVFGGREIYQLFLPHISTMFITHVDHEFEGDTYFPEIDWSEWEDISRREGTIDDRNLYPHTFVIYKRKEAY